MFFRFLNFSLLVCFFPLLPLSFFLLPSSFQKCMYIKIWILVFFSLPCGLTVNETLAKIESSSQDGGVGRNPSLPRTTKRGRTTNLKSKQPEAPENQTAWNSDNQGIKEKINQNNQTGSAAMQQGGSPCPSKHLRPRPLTTYQVRQDKEIWHK